MRSDRLVALTVLMAGFSIGLVGCKGAETSAKAEEPKASGKPPIPKPQMLGGAEAPEGLPLDKIPSGLRNDAFEYYGLGNPGPVSFTVSSPAIPGGSQEASQTLRLIDVKDGEARFAVSYTGALEREGEHEMLLKPEGLYVIKAGGKVLPKPEMELPSPMAVGAKWHQHLSMEAPTGGTIEVDADFLVVGPEKVKTKAGEFDAIRVNGSSLMKTGGKTIKQSLIGWYVKGTGQVKLSVKGLSGNPNEAMSVEIVK